MARVLEMPENHQVAEHQHAWGQLAYASRGIMKVDIPSASFIIPPERALWLPAGVPHKVSTRYGLSFRSLYISNECAKSLPNKATAITVNSLLKELILEISNWTESYTLTTTKKRFIAVLIDQLSEAKRSRLFLNEPTDKRLKKITNTLEKKPADNTTLEQWSLSIGATPRTLNRLFQKETNMGFVEWRQKLRILYSLEKIARGENMDLIANTLGYESSSAFISMFKKHLGVSPKRFLKKL